MSIVIQNDNLTNILLRIKTLGNNLDDITLKNNLNYEIYEDYNLFTLFNTDRKENKCFDLADGISDFFRFIVLNKNLDPIVNFYYKSIYDDNAIKELTNLSEQEWHNIEITKLHLNTKHICLFNDDNNWYICYSNIVEKLSDDLETMSNGVTSIFINFIKEKDMCLDDFDKSNVYHFLLKHENFKKKGLGTIPKQNERNLLILYICDKNCNIISNVFDTKFDFLSKIQQEKKIYFSCIDEMLTSLEIMNNDNIMSKNIQFGGYYLKLQSPDKKGYKFYFIRTEIYRHILSSIPKHDNQYKNYLELYQCDKLTEILPYLHKYPADVIRRINMSVKTMSKDILNIYHLTRKKQNEKLYKILPLSYRKVLYDLHKIYVNQKCDELIIKSQDILKDKRSISVDIVYNYLKNIKGIELIKLFYDRIKLISDLKELNNDEIKEGYNDLKYMSIISIDNIDIAVQTALMFQ